MSTNSNSNTGILPATESSVSPARSSPSPVLQRGKACLACRRRKIRCDGIRPVCTPCLRGERVEDCEYTDGPRRPRTLRLEEDIARLKARLQELENPEEVSPSVGLHDPYAGVDTSTGSTSTPTSIIHARSQAPSPVLLYDSIGRRTDPHPGYSSGSATDPNWVVDLEPEIQLHARRALSVIAPHADEIGFFLRADRFRLQGSHILPALQNVLTLWSAHITSTSEPDYEQNRERTESFKAYLLSQAQTQLTLSLNTVDSEPDPAIILHVIQTGVLLAYYMQRVGQGVGARYYASGTWTLVMMLKLYRRSRASVGAGERDGRIPVESTDMDPNMPMFSLMGCARLPPPLDEIEAEERARAFWAVYALDLWFGAVYKAPCQSLSMNRNAGDTMTIQWPGVRNVGEIDSNVVQRFLSDPDHDFTRDGALAMQAKASVLLGEATRLATSYVNDHTIFQSPAFQARLTTLDMLLQRCWSLAMVMATSVPHGHQIPRTPKQAQVLVTVHLVALGHVTLHRPWLSTYVPAQRRCVESALGVVRVLDLLGTTAATAGSISPMYATVWTSLCLVLHDETLRRHAQPPDSDPSRLREEEEMMRAIRKLVSLVSGLSQRYPSRFFAANIEAVLPVLASIAGP